MSGGTMDWSLWDMPVIAQIVGWENPNPIHKMARNMEESIHCHLR
jgi:hypothetical protein